MYAVIKTGGKQYRVAADDTIEIERLKGEAGDTVEFGEVLLVANGDALDFGAPFLAGATVAGEIVSHTRGPKLVIFKKRRRKHYRRKNGHRQDLTEVRITEILTGGAKPAKKEAARKPAAEAQPLMADPKPERAAPKAEKTGDDLSLIAGIGPKINATLSELGYVSFAQIAALTAPEIEKIEEAVKSKGRVERDEWIEQAKELMAGKPPRAKADKEAKAERAKAAPKASE